MLDIRHHVRVGEPARPAHEVDEDLIGDPHDDVFSDVGVVDIRRGVIGKNTEREFYARDVVRRVVDEQVDVFGKSRGAVGDDSEAADEDVPSAGAVQRPADADEVCRLRRSCVRRIVSVIHVSASSKLAKR